MMHKYLSTRLIYTSAIIGVPILALRCEFRYVEGFDEDHSMMGEAPSLFYKRVSEYHARSVKRIALIECGNPAGR